MRGIIAFAEYSWSGDKRTKEAIKSAYRQREFSSSLSGDEYAFIDQLEIPVQFWKYALLKENNRNRLQKLDGSMVEEIIDFPIGSEKGEWSKRNFQRLKQASIVLDLCDSISIKIASMKSIAVRNNYTLEVYEQVNNMARFAPKAMLALQAYDKAPNEEQELEALKRIRQLPVEFEELRKQLESVYSKTRILTKPEDYILDQDHHSHLANQTISFDWQFYAEMLFVEKIETQLDRGLD